MEKRNFQISTDVSLYNRAKEVINNSFNKDGRDFLVSALDCLLEKSVNKRDIELSAKELAIVEEAIKVSGLNYHDLLKRGLLTECRKEIKLAEQRPKLNLLDDSELIKHTIRGVAAIRIKRAIDAIATYNDETEDKADKLYISRTLVAQLSGSNVKAVNKYFEENQALINELNSKYGLDPSMNRKGKGHNVKEKIKFDT